MKGGKKESQNFTGLSLVTEYSSVTTLEIDELMPRLFSEKNRQDIIKIVTEHVRNIFYPALKGQHVTLDFFSKVFNFVHKKLCGDNFKIKYSVSWVREHFLLKQFGDSETFSTIFGGKTRTKVRNIQMILHGEGDSKYLIYVISTGCNKSVNALKRQIAFTSSCLLFIENQNGIVNRISQTPNRVQTTRNPPGESSPRRELVWNIRITYEGSSLNGDEDKDSENTNEAGRSEGVGQTTGTSPKSNNTLSSEAGCSHSTGSNNNCSEGGNSEGNISDDYLEEEDGFEKALLLNNRNETLPNELQTFPKTFGEKYMAVEYANPSASPELLPEPEEPMDIDVTPIESTSSNRPIDEPFNLIGVAQESKTDNANRAEILTAILKSINFAEIILGSGCRKDTEDSSARQQATSTSKLLDSGNSTLSIRDEVPPIAISEISSVRVPTENNNTLVEEADDDDIIFLEHSRPNKITPNGDDVLFVSDNEDGDMDDLNAIADTTNNRKDWQSQNSAVPPSNEFDLEGIEIIDDIDPEDYNTYHKH